MKRDIFSNNYSLKTPKTKQLLKCAFAILWSTAITLVHQNIPDNFRFEQVVSKKLHFFKYENKLRYLDNMHS